MPLRVICLCTYRTAGRDWRSRDWAASKFIKAIKKKQINGYAHVPVGDSVEYLTSNTAAQAPEWFARMAVSRIAWRNVDNIAIVPVPDSNCADDATKPKTLRLAEAFAERFHGNAVISDVLRWSEEMPSSHAAGGTRDPQELYYRLRLSGDLPPEDRRVVIVDDVLTSGGHLRATSAFLRDRGRTVVVAIVAGRADNAPIAGADAFENRIETLDDFRNDPDWKPLDLDPDFDIEDFFKTR